MCDDQKSQIMFESIIKSQTVVKTFVLQRQDTHQSTIVQQDVDMSSPSVDLNPILETYCPLSTHKVSLYHPQLNKFQEVQSLNVSSTSSRVQIPTHIIEPSVILIRYRLLGGEEESVNDSISQSSKSSRKEGRHRQRTIGQVIELVKRWRNLHLHGHGPQKRRVNLQEAARLVGVSKKSLDDYYCQLRLGEFYEFDFGANMGQRVGVLRSFVKEYKPEKDGRKRHNQKHPKNLRVIEEFEMPPMNEEMAVQVMPQVEMGVMMDPFMEEEKIEDIHQSINNLPPVSLDFFNIEHEFFRGFEDLGEGPDLYDPIGDFRRKDYHEESNSSFLYF